MIMQAKSDYVPPAKRPVAAAPVLSPAEVASLPPWLEAMRAAMSEAMKPEDLTAILQKQVEKAKSGDVRAAAFVVDQANKMLSAEQRRPISITQNNFYGDAEDPAEPTTSVPGSDARIKRMRNRLVMGVPLHSDDDRDPRVLDDDEAEKRFRREHAQVEGED